jgi:hypothetical protein
MDLDLAEFYALLAIGVVTPYVAVATMNWMRRSGRSKSVRRFLRSQFSQLPNQEDCLS